MKNLSRLTKATAVYGVLSSTAKSIYSDQVDMTEYDGCLFSAMFKSTAGSTGTAAFTIVGTNSSTAGSTAYATINGASATVAKSTSADDKRLVQIDVDKSTYRYLKAKLVKQAKILLSGIIAQQYAGSHLPASTASGTNVLTVAGT